MHLPLPSRRVFQLGLLLLPALVGQLGPAAGRGQAQELSPRAYWPAPKGTQVLVAGYAFSSGDIVTDPSLPIAGVDSRIHTLQLGYLRTLNLAGRTANLVVEAPWVEGTTRGQVEGVPRRRDISGLGDVAATLSVNLLGAPTMTPADFQELRRNPRPILGASLKVVAPTGEYEKDRLINVGSNRWAARLQLGYIHPVKPRWLLEVAGGAWLFGDNDDFLGTTREQHPIAAAELHVVRRFKPGFWASFDLNHYTGGRSVIDGVSRGTILRNWRYGATVVVPFHRRNAVKVGASRGLITESGQNYDTILLSYQRAFAPQRQR